jgi:hypothetical protein
MFKVVEFVYTPVHLLILVKINGFKIEFIVQFDTFYFEQTRLQQSL